MLYLNMIYKNKLKKRNAFEGRECVWYMSKLIKKEKKNRIMLEFGYDFKK